MMTSILGARWHIYLLFLVAVLVLQPLSLWLRCLVLHRSARVSDDRLAEWALSEASSRRVVELVRALRDREAPQEQLTQPPEQPFK